MVNLFFASSCYYVCMKIWISIIIALINLVLFNPTTNAVELNSAENKGSIIATENFDTPFVKVDNFDNQFLSLQTSREKNLSNQNKSDEENFGFTGFTEFKNYKSQNLKIYNTAYNLSFADIASDCSHFLSEINRH